MSLPDIQFDEEKHAYTMNGCPAPGITKILRLGGIIDWMPKNNEALLRGTRVHKATELDDKGELDETHFAEKFPDLIGYLEAWRKCKVEEKFKILSIEEPVGVPEDWYCTCLDRRVMLTDGRETVFNLKTGGRWPHYQIQAAAELKAAYHCFGTSSLFWVVLMPDGSYEMDEYRPKEKYYKLWESALDIANWKFQTGQASIGPKPPPKEEKPEDLPFESSALFDSIETKKAEGLFGEGKNE